jgi:SAM-dependent methyltransferase
MDFNIPDPVKTIAANDEMFNANTDHYFNVGRSAMANILSALDLANKATCETILDLPCGYGRVLRYLTAKFPHAKVTACDLNRNAVEFCVDTFGAVGYLSATNPVGLQLQTTYDLIWCGSLLTHLDHALWGSFLDFFTRHLKDDGVLVFTTHGRLSAKWLYENIQDYGLEKKAVAAILASYKRTGFGYADYPNNSEYGISIASPSWVLGQVERVYHLKILSFTETGWDKHQDVISCTRSFNHDGSRLLYNRE